MNEYKMIAAVRKYALDHYEDGDGWDYVVEAWADGDILEVAGNAKTFAEAIKLVGEEVGIIAEREAEVRAEIF
jgi:hypothetical protein